MVVVMMMAMVMVVMMIVTNGGGFLLFLQSLLCWCDLVSRFVIIIFHNDFDSGNGFIAL